MSLGQKLLWLALAGALGALARHGLAGVIHRAVDTPFPLGTALVNMTGCLLFGVIWAISAERMLISGEVRIILLVGFTGAFTTFSSFAFENTILLRESAWWLALANVVGQNVLGVAFVALGMALGRGM